AREKKLVTQMGIQIQSHAVHRTVVATIRAGAIGRIREVHSWSGKSLGDRALRPDRKDTIPPGFNWDLWLGVAAERPFLGNAYYHPFNWRIRVDFGTGTLGDMGCHILDPVFSALALGAPTAIRSDGDAPNSENWALDGQLRYTFPGTKYTEDTVTLFWYDGSKRPPASVKALLGKTPLNDQGSIYIGANGALYSPYIAAPLLFPKDKFADFKWPQPGDVDHYLQFVEACRGNGKTMASFDYSGPLTEAVLLGCLATRFPGTVLDWDSSQLKTNLAAANQFIRKAYRKGWEVDGL